MKKEGGRMLKTIRNAKGFTLVELAIVLVIIGIILGAVLKGQELINNAKTKRVYSQYREISAAMYTYMDRYQLFPGDDNAAAARWSTVLTVRNGNGNGLICAAAASTAPTFTCTASAAGEQCDLWAMLRLSNIIGGGTAAATAFINPRHAYGGAIGISYQTLGTPARLRNWVHFENIPPEVGLILDTSYDDGVATTGSIQTVTATGYTAGGPVVILSLEL